MNVEQIHDSQNIRRASEGERRVKLMFKDAFFSRRLEGMSIYHDVEFFSNDGKILFQHDHILISQYRAIIIETKFWKGETIISCNPQRLDLFRPQYENMIFKSNEVELVIYNKKTRNERCKINVEINFYPPHEGTDILSHLKDKSLSLYNKFHVNTSYALVFVEQGDEHITVFEDIPFSKKFYCQVEPYMSICPLNIAESIINNLASESSTTPPEKIEKLKSYLETHSKCVQDINNPEGRIICH